MTKRIGTMAAGIVIGLVVTGILLYQEEKKAADGNADDSGDKRNGLYAEISGNTVRTYEVRDGRFCGYSEPRTFESYDKAMEWAVKETGAKIVIKNTQEEE